MQPGCFSKAATDLCVQTSFCDDGLTQWQWLRSQQPGAEKHTEQPGLSESTEGFFAIQDAEQQLYIPSEADAGYTVMVQCTPTSRSAL